MLFPQNKAVISHQLLYLTLMFLFSLEKAVTAIIKLTLLRIIISEATPTNMKSLDFGLCFRFWQKASSPYAHLHSDKMKTVIKSTMQLDRVIGPFISLGPNLIFSDYLMPLYSL